MSAPRTIIAVDWSARAAPSSVKPVRDAIFACVHRPGVPGHPAYFRTRTALMDWLNGVLDDELVAGRKVLAGFDFAFGYPAGFAQALTGTPDPLAVWDWLDTRIEDGADNANNRFEIAARMNARFPGVGPFWGCPAGLGLAGLPEKGSARAGHGMAEKRLVEQICGAQPVWKLYTTGAVGSQSLLGLPRLAQLRRRLGARCAVWPMQQVGAADVTLTEIYPSVVRMAYDRPLTDQFPDETYQIPDAEQVRAVCDAYAAIPPTAWDGVFAAPARQAQAREEGWILGVDLPHRLAA